MRVFSKLQVFISSEAPALCPALSTIAAQLSAAEHQTTICPAFLAEVEYSQLALIRFAMTLYETAPHVKSCPLIVEKMPRKLFSCDIMI